MKKTAAALSLLALAACANMQQQDGPSTAFRLTSPGMPDNSKLPPQAAGNFAKNPNCTGQNVSPALKWSGAPKGTKSFALMVHDPDAPTGGAGWWHWVVVNLPADTKELKKGAGAAAGGELPAGAIQIATDFGAPGWGGPCPPAGDKPHHYHFTIYALKVDKLELPEGARASLAGFMVNANAIGKATLTGKYGRKK